MSNLTSITYDSTYTYPYQATNPLSHTATTVYDPKYGKVISETEPNGNTTTYAYDVFGRRTKVTGPLDSTSTYGTVSYEYQDCGTANLRIVTNSTEESGTANYLKSEVCLDGLERTIKTWKEGPDGSTIVQDIEYDSTGRVYRKSLPYFDGTGSPKWITYTYDPVGRVTQITNPDSTVVTTSYDKSTTTFIDANGHKKVEVKDVYGRLIKVEEYTGTTGSHALYATTTYEYNARGNLIKLTDTESNQTTMTYDTLGRKLTMNDPDMGSWSYSYDNNGNLLSQTDAKNQTINFTYDELNRTTRKIYPVGSDTIYAYDETFSTNPTGRLTTLTDSTGSTKYYYDELGRTVKAIKTVDTTSYTTETTYDALSRTTSITYPDSKRVNYTYDTGGNLLTIVDDVSSGSTHTPAIPATTLLGRLKE
jgi:YD repeat-containing protein